MADGNDETFSSENDWSNVHSTRTKKKKWLAESGVDDEKAKKMQAGMRKASMMGMGSKIASMFGMHENSDE